MKQMGGWAALPALVIFIVLSAPGRAQTSLDALEKDLDQVKQEHADATSQALASFETALQNASDSPAAALQLYQQAGGDLPGATKVSSQYDYETPSEKAQRLARDQANLIGLGQMLQLHCGMLRLGALLVSEPGTANLHQDWIAWLKQAAQIFPSLTGARSIREMKLKDSPIGAYLKFYGWGESEQGGWSVHDLPELFLNDVLTPLRRAPNADTLAAWDSYIAMRAALNAFVEADLASLQQQQDEMNSGNATGTGSGGGNERHEGGRHGDAQTDAQNPDALRGRAERRDSLKTQIDEDQSKIDKWINEELPGLQFERGCDDFASGPTEDKLAALVAMIKDHPTHSKSGQWIARVHAMLVAFKSGHIADAVAAAIGSGTAPAGSPAAPDPADPATTNVAPADPTTSTTNAPPGVSSTGGH